MSPLEAPALSIVIVTFNGCDLVRACLRSIPAGLGPRTGEIIVVDNGSRDGTPEMIAAEFPAVHLIATGENLGFAAGNNRALPHVRGGIVVFLNPDTEPAPGSLARLADALDADPTLGIVAPRLTNADGSLQPSVRGFPTVGASLVVLLKLHRVAGWIPAVARYDAAAFDYDRPADVEQLMGACLAMPRPVVERLGGFDERFWMWFEEVDLCLRARQAGLRVRYLPDAVVLHRLNQSAVLLHSVFAQRRYGQSLVRYFEKHHARWQATLLRSVSWTGVLAAYGVQLARRVRDRSGRKYHVNAGGRDG